MPKTFLTLIATLTIISIGIFIIPRDSDIAVGHTPQVAAVGASTTTQTASLRAKRGNPGHVHEPLDYHVAPLRYTPRNDGQLEVPSSTQPVAIPKADVATLTIAGTPHEVTAHQNVIEAMHALAASADITFSGRDYPSLGFFVVSINEKENENGHYWMLYVNGTQSAKGASHTTLLPGDTVEWRYK